MNRSRIRSWGAIASMVGAATFLIVVLILHLLQPDFEPRHQLMSELALGQHGWAMFVAFLGLAAAVLGLQAVVAQSGGSRACSVVLGAAALFFLAAGVFPLGANSLIHIIAIAAAFVLSVLGMFLFPTSAGRASAAGSRAISWPLAVGVAASVALGDAAIPMGIGQRLAAACLLIWLGVVGWRVYRLGIEPYPNL